MKQIYLIGGNIINNHLTNLIKNIITNQNNNITILIFPWTREIENPKYRTKIIDYFKGIGIKIINFADLGDSFEIIKNKIDSSDIIYLPGGDSKLLIERLKNKKINSLLEKYDNLIIGNSAGAHALSEMYIGMGDRGEREKTEILNGMNLTNLNTVVHYGERYDKELIEISKIIKSKIYCIPEESGLLYNDEGIKAFGKVYVFDKGNKIELK